MRYRITTLGCRVNHAEAREMESALLSRGLTRAADGEPATVEVVHTCSVTNTAAAKSRRALRQALRRSSTRSHRVPHDPDSAGGAPRLFVTGCYGGTDAETAAGIAGGAGFVIPHDGGDGSSLTERFARQLDRWLTDRHPHQLLRSSGEASCRRPPATLPAVAPRRSAGAHVRAELKIQDGCDAACTFCVIPRIRRQLRSKTVADAVGEARRLVELGHREIVLTGIFIGAYGHETALRRRQRGPGARALADLIDAVASVPGLQRLRVSSLEPGDVDDDLLSALRDNRPVVVPHLHLPLQSGSDAVLRRMNRQYRVGAYLEMIDAVNGALTDHDGLPPAITTDVICGFPGETDEDFERTVEVARRVGYLHMHVFPFSPKRGTAAARWRDRFVPPATVRARVRRLLDLEQDPEDGLSLLFRRRLLGRAVRVIVERRDADDPRLATGRCDHYASIVLETDRPRGAVVTAEVTEVTPGRTAARALETRIPLPVAG